MKLNKHALTALLGASLISICGIAHAQENDAPSRAYSASIGTAIPSPLDARIRYYAFSPDVVYTLPITVGMHTHLALGPDESLVETPKLGETIQWRISGNSSNLYIKALQPGVRTSLTLITDKRAYQFELVSTNETAQRIQKAYFQYPDEEDQAGLRYQNLLKAQKREAAKVEEVALSRAVDPADLNFKYDISGTAAFKPSAVYDDGKFTYFRLPNTQDLPAIFMAEEGSRTKLTPINYAIKGDQVVIERTAKTFVMKLGAAEVRIVRSK
jgi:type IV secretion system protein VirB9